MANAPPVPQIFGVVTVDGHEYIERPIILGMRVTISSSKQTFSSIPLTLPGTAPFLLKGLTRDITANETGTFNVSSSDRRFRFNLRHSQGSTWFFTSGLWIFDDRVIDTMCFGSGQFPFPIIPPVPAPANGTLFMDVEDMGFDTPSDPDYFPYEIHFGFHGSFLFPANTPARG